MKAATHNGHCQVCGKIQALPFDGRLSLHGYKVAGFGFFAGVCQGARHLPLQQERTKTDAIIVALREYAVRQSERAVELQTGRSNPEQARSGKYVKVLKTGRRGYQYESSEPEMVDFSLAPPYYQKQAVDAAIAEAQSEARHARGFADNLQQLADRIHGTPLIDVVENTTPRSTDLKAGDVLKLGDDKLPIKLIGRCEVRVGFRGNYAGGWVVEVEGRGTFKRSDSEISRAISRAEKAGKAWRA